MSNLSLSRDLVKIPQAISSDFDYLTSFFYRARLLRARYCYSKLSVRLSVGPWRWSIVTHRFLFYENNFTVSERGVFALRRPQTQTSRIYSKENTHKFWSE